MRARMIVILWMLCLVQIPVYASESDPSISFQEVAAATGIFYQHLPADHYAKLRTLLQKPTITPDMEGDAPFKSWGSPGVATLDFDRDGDLDIYVTNARGVANSLFVNQLIPTGRLSFMDTASAVGIAAQDADGTGVCYGDTDNDGDDDLFVLGEGQSKRFFVNQLEGGKAIFYDYSAESGLNNGADYMSMSCSFGDINGDGLLDVVIANSFDLAYRLPLITPIGLGHPNQLFLNLGNNHFVDVSETAGIRINASIGAAASITWSTAMVDIDRDGDVDIFLAGDQAGVPPKMGQTGINRGYLQFFENDGTGHFTNQTNARGLPIGDWMGLAIGDLNCDQYLDVFATNFGDYFKPMDSARVSSRWFLGTAKGSFLDSQYWKQGISAFGWGVGLLDADNDADLDITYFGGYEGFWELQITNPGIILQNQDCKADFKINVDALGGRSLRRLVQGVATADINNDGFADIIDVSSADIPPTVPIVSDLVRANTPLNKTAGKVSLLQPKRFAWKFTDTISKLQPGTLALELNNSKSHNHWMKVTLVGTVGLVPGAHTNRSAIGAVIAFTVADKATNTDKTVTKPIMGGASYASQDSLTALFGMGSAPQGTLDIWWTGGTHNRFYEVRAGEVLTFPEIPCDLDDPTQSQIAYARCVTDTLDTLTQQGLISHSFALRVQESAMRAYSELQERILPCP